MRQLLKYPIDTTTRQCPPLAESRRSRTSASDPEQSLRYYVLLQRGSTNVALWKSTQRRLALESDDEALPERF